MAGRRAPGIFPQTAEPGIPPLPGDSHPSGTYVAGSTKGEVMNQLPGFALVPFIALGWLITEAFFRAGHREQDEAW